jgi:hypothetical protein
MQKKEITRGELEIIVKSDNIKKFFLDKEDIRFFSLKFKIKYTFLENYLLKNSIIVKTDKLDKLLKYLDISVENKTIDIKEFDKLGDWKKEVFKNSKIFVNFDCENCGLNSKSRLDKTINRKFFSLKPICSKCIGKKVTNTFEWKNTNSEAQKIAQNKPETKTRMSEIVKKRCSNIEYRKKMSDTSKKVWKKEGYKKKMSDLVLKRWENPDYAQKVIENKKKSGIVGYYKKIFYDSGYELAFLLKEESEQGSLNHVKRVDFFIKYKDKEFKERSYYSDYIKNDEYLIEIKGYGPWVDLDNLDNKNKSAREWCDINNKKFRVVEYKDFGSFWYSQARRKHKELKNGEIKK